MNLSAFQPFFYVTQPSLSAQFSDGASFFFNNLRTYTDWKSFSVIKSASEDTGEIVLGQITIGKFHNSLVKKLENNGLVISCNDYFELSGVGSIFNVIAPYTWSYYNIAHHHLPFTNFSNKTDPFLVIQTLQKMLDVHNNNGTIYIHCMAGRSRSALISALFTCISKVDLQNKLLNASNDRDLSEILLSAVKQIRKHRDQIWVGRAKLALGIDVLKQYIAFWKGEHQEPSVFNLVKTADNALNASQCLSAISQSCEYKFIWDQAYKRSELFKSIQKFAENIYLYVEERKDQAFIIDQLIQSVYQQMMPNDQEIIQQLHSVYLASEAFMDQIKKHPVHVQALGIDLLDKILKSGCAYKKKTECLNQTTDYLENPSAKNLELYYKQLQSIFVSRNIALQIIGAAMMLLGMAVIMVSLVDACFATAGTFGIAMATLGASALGCFEIGIGKLVYDYGASDGVAQASSNLVAEIEFDAPQDHSTLMLNS